METWVDVQPILSSCSDQVLGLPFQQRKCIIPSDLNVESYRQPACMLGCVRKEIHKRCYCHPFHLPRDNDTKVFRDCKAKDIFCFVENYCEGFSDFLNDKLIFLSSVDFKTVKCDHCFPSCTDIFYKANSFQTPFKGYKYSINEF